MADVGAIVAGTLVAGLLFGVVAAFLVLRSRSRLSRGLSSVHILREDAETKYLEDSQVSSVNFNRANDPLSILRELYLLGPTSDAELIGDLNALGESIRVHVIRCYSIGPVAADHASVLAILSGLFEVVGTRPDPALDAHNILGLVMNPGTRHVALRSVFCRLLFSAIDFDAGTQARLSLLPPPIAAFVRNVPPVEPLGGNMNGESLVWIYHCLLQSWLTILDLGPSCKTIIPRGSYL